MEAPAPTTIKVIVFDFHQTLVVDQILSRPSTVVYDNWKALRLDVFRDPDWLKTFLISARAAGLVIGIATNQEDRFDGLSDEQMRTVARIEREQDRVMTSQEIDSRRDLSTFVAGKRLITATLDTLWNEHEDARERTRARQRVIPDDLIVTLDWGTVRTAGLNKHRHMEMIVERVRAKYGIRDLRNAQAILFDDSPRNIFDVQSYGYSGLAVSPSITFAQRFWEETAAPYPEVVSIKYTIANFARQRAVVRALVSSVEQICIIAINGRDKWARLSAENSGPGAEGEISLVRPFNEIPALTTVNPGTGDDERAVLINALLSYTAASAGLASACSSPVQDAEQAYSGQLAAASNSLTEYARRHALWPAQAINALNEMDARRHTFFDVCADAYNKKLQDIVDQPMVIYAKQMYVEAARSFGQQI